MEGGAPIDGVIRVGDFSSVIWGAPPATYFSGIVGIPKYNDLAGNVIRHSLQGFIPLDTRLITPGDAQGDLEFTVHGKLSCPAIPNPLTDTLDLRLWISTLPIGTGSVQRQTSIALAPNISIVSSISPVASNPATNNQITITKHTFTIPNTQLVAANTAAFWFKVERVDAGSGGGGSSTFNINNQENFYIMDNIRYNLKIILVMQPNHYQNLYMNSQYWLQVL